MLLQNMCKPFTFFLEFFYTSDNLYGDEYFVVELVVSYSALKRQKERFWHMP